MLKPKIYKNENRNRTISVVMSDELISLINADVESEYLSAGAVIRRAVWSYYKQLRNAKPVETSRPVLSPSIETFVQKLDETGAEAGR